MAGLRHLWLLGQLHPYSPPKSAAQNMSGGAFHFQGNMKLYACRNAAFNSESAKSQAKKFINFLVSPSRTHDANPNGNQIKSSIKMIAAFAA
jgi:hypothetical protein